CGAAPSLLGDAERDETERDLARFDQLEVLDRTIGLTRGDGEAELPGEQLCEALTVLMVGAAARGRADGERLGPVHLRNGPAREADGRDHGRGDPKQCARHVRPPYVVIGRTGPAWSMSSSTTTFSGVSASASVSLLRCACIRSTSSAPSHLETTTVATPL